MESPGQRITAPRKAEWLNRAGGISFGIGVQLIFAWTVVKLFLFLYQGSTNTDPFSWKLDALLAIQFAVPHSLLLWPPCAKRLKKWIPAEFYGAFYCLVTCCSLLLLFQGWTSSGQTLWNCEGNLLLAVRAGFFASWAALFYSLHLTGLGFQTGLTQWWHWLRRLPQPRRGLAVRGAYRFMRHPVYLSFLGLIWLTPRMTLDHVVLTGLWTIYILIGSSLKDQRMAHYLGEPYRRYQAAVPGYPWEALARTSTWPRPPVLVKKHRSRQPANNPSHLAGRHAT